MATVWFALLVGVLAVYVVLDGFDFGAGALHLVVARRDGERRQVLAAIGPFWDGNEVWLLAAGGVLFLAFPRALGSGLSGFYLPIFFFLWVLVLRGLAIELRSHLDDAMWRAFWDAVFALASLAAPLLLGVALGNLVRGVPLREDGWFALPLFTSFSPRGAIGVLDWYTLVVGAFAVLAVSHHGALFLAWKTEGPVRERCRALARRLGPATAVGWLVVTAASAAAAPELVARAAGRPLAWLAAALFVAGLLASLLVRASDLVAFLGSSLFLFASLAATGVLLYPALVPASTGASRSLTVTNAAAGSASLRAGLLWWPAGLLLAIGYFVVLFHHHRGPVPPPEAGS